MTESDKERFNMRIVGELLVWDCLKNDNDTADIGADIKITESPLYDCISQYAMLHGEDLQGMFKDEKYEYMSCFIRDVAAFRNEFGKEEVLNSLFNHGKGESAEFVISFPESEFSLDDDAKWILHLTHVSYDKSLDVYLLVPDSLDYNFVYRVVARLQYIHSEGHYKTEDLSCRQMSFLLKKLLNIDIVKDEKKPLIEHVHQLDLFWNWEQCVVAFCFDEDSKSKGDKPHFYPDVDFSDYEPDGVIPALLEMDKHDDLRI